MSKLHLNYDQFDGNLYAWCGRGTNVGTELQFEAADPTTRCQICDREWFPNGQPEWHREYAIKQLEVK